MMRWTDEPGNFFRGLKSEPRDMGTWRTIANQSHCTVDVQVFRFAGEVLLDMRCCTRLEPAEARRLARVLTDAADEAERLNKENET